MEHEPYPITTEDQNRSVTSPFNPLVSEMLPAFLDHIKVEDNRSSGTLIRYKRHIERFMIEAGDCRVADITSERLSYFKRRMLDEGLSPATMAAILSCLRTFLRYLHQVHGLMVFDPEKVRRPKIPKREVDYLTREEIERFFNAIPTHTVVGLRDRALAELIYASGMRISEVLSLNRSQIDWEAREARIVGKGQKARKVYFSQEALDWLARYLLHRHDDNASVFVTIGDPPESLQGQGTWKRFHKYARTAGIAKHVYPHMLRHTMATTLLANGCPIGHIKVLLGHENLTTTCKYYLGVISDSEVKAAHQKFISYKPETGEETDGKRDREKNSGHTNLDIASY